MKKIAILGSTGSIGTQTLEVISDNKNIFEVELLSAFSNDNLLITQALLYKPTTEVAAYIRGESNLTWGEFKDEFLDEHSISLTDSLHKSGY